MEKVVINGTPRTELGKKATRALRKAGNVPCNLYGGKETLNFYAPVPSFKKLIYTPEFRVAEISLNGKTYIAILKDSQFDPIKDTMMHLDFQEMQDNVKVKVAVPIRLNGTAKGIIEGGKLEVPFRKLNILALPKDIPNSIEIDVTDMGLGAIKRIKDLEIAGVTILHPGSNPFAKVMIPRAAAAEVATAAAATAAAPAAAAKPDAKAAAPAKDEKKK